jgi:hypothetical protein
MLNLKMISLKSKETLGDSLKKTNKILSKFKYLRIFKLFLFLIKKSKHSRKLQSIEFNFKKK